MNQKSYRRTLLSFMLIFALLFSSSAFSSIKADAKTKAPKLSTKKITLSTGTTKKVTLMNKPKGAKVNWSSKNKKIASVKKGKITGIKKGSTKILCKVVYKKNKKKITKKLYVKVTVVAKKVSDSKSTQVPVSTVAPTPYVEPGINASNLTVEHMSKNGLKTKDNGMMRKSLTSLELVDKALGIGWNLGNQMEQSNYKGKMKDVYECETSAGNAEAKQKLFDGLKSYGVSTVRIPVAWSNFISTDGKYTINEDLFNRVEEIVNYALNDEMYVIINIHWDGGWWGMFGSPDEAVRAQAWKKYESIWTQISERFKEYSDRLIFEGGNEELSSAFPTTGNLGLNTRVGADGFFDTSGPVGTLTEDEIYETAYRISQKFVDIVRASGGNNTYRHLLIPGNTTAIDKACDERFKMPEDIKENGKTKMFLSVHIYDPQEYGLSATATDAAGYRDTWGVDWTDSEGVLHKGEEDKEWLENHIAKIKKFTDEGYGVIAGECGVVKGYKDNIIDYLDYYFDLCKKYHVAPVLWDEGHYFDRAGGYFQYSDVGELIAKRTGSTPVIPAKAQTKLTGITKVPQEENKDPKVVYTWTGEFMRHTNEDTGIELQNSNREHLIFNSKGEAGIEYTESVSEGLEAEINDEWWNIHLTCDWSSLKKPCVRIYPQNNEVSGGADLQVGYMAGRDSKVYNDADYMSNWVGKYITIDKDLMAELQSQIPELREKELSKKTPKETLYNSDTPWLWITTNTYTGASYVKIEICDAAYNSDGTEYVGTSE